jgi:type IV pilus assembly protein PilA
MKGFVVIEIMFVVAIIGVLSIMATPTYLYYLKQAMIVEASTLAPFIQKEVIDYFHFTGKFPKNNQELAFDKTSKLSGSYVKNINVENGAIHFYFDSNGISGYLSFLPSFKIHDPLTTSPTISTINWLCGYMKQPEDWYIQGENKTNLPPLYLPNICRG